MGNYILRRLLLIIPTLLGILTINFIIIQAAPGGPVEQTLAQLEGLSVEATGRIGSAVQSDIIQNSNGDSSYRGSKKLRTLKKA